MSLLSGLVVFFLIWWTALFVILPLGVRPEPEADAESGWRGAPRRPRMLRVVVLTTLLTAVLWLGAYALIESEWFSFRSGWLALPEK